MTRPARPSPPGERATTHRAQLEQQIEEARALQQELEAANLQLAVLVQQTEDARNQALVDRVRAARDAEFIAGLDRLLADAHRDYDATLAAVARYAVPYLADYASIDVLTEDGTIRRVAWAHRDATKESLLIELWQRFPYRTSDGVGAPVVFRTGEPQLRPTFEIGEIEAFADDPDRRAMMMALGPSSYMCVPLAFGGHVLGALSLVMSDSRRRYDSHALEMATELARRAAGAVEGARLYRELSEAAARDAFLAEASAVLASSLDYEATLASVARLGVPRLADWCSVYVVDETGALRRLVVAHADPDRVRWAGELEQRYRLQPDAPVGPPQVVRTGRSELFADFPDDLIVRIALDAAHLRMLREIGIRSSMTVPIVTGDRVLGAIAMLTTAESNRRYTTRDLALAEDLGRRAGIAIDNARLFEEVRQARAEAEAANAAKSAFLTTMSHELRTPLNAIGGYADLLMTGVRGPVSPEQARDLARIRNAGQHLLGLINDVLNYAKLEAVQVRFNVRDVPLEQVVAAAEEMILPQARQRDLTFERARAIPGATVRADPEKVQQILLNLLSNAVKFTAAGGRITVRGTADSGTVRATVSDTGCGIATMELERIFEPFVQVGRGLTTRNEGAGLGLAISRGLARGMGGDLTVASTLGQGSTFTLVLPRGS